VGDRRPYRGLSAHERILERRTRLLDAALELFGTRGYAATTIEDLCASAKVSTRGFYECFDSRDDLLITLHDGLLREAFEAMNLARARLGEPFDVVDIVNRANAGLHAYVGFIAADIRRARVLHVEMLVMGQSYDRMRQGVKGECVKLITSDYAAAFLAGGIDSGIEEAPVNITYLAVGLTGAIRELMTDWVLGHERMPPEQLVKAAEFLIVAALDRAIAEARRASIARREPRSA
jgi:AcrR family transcriptional regulator